MIFAMSTTTYAAEIIPNEKRTVSDVLTQINAEYGTNIHILSEEELEKYGLPKTEMKQSNCVDIEDLEATLRYLAEFKIPEFEKATQYARLFLDDGTNEASITGYSSDTVIATKAIDYATAAVEAYTTTDSKGNKKWGSISEFVDEGISVISTAVAKKIATYLGMSSSALTWLVGGTIGVSVWILQNLDKWDLSDAIDNSTTGKVKLEFYYLVSSFEPYYQEFKNFEAWNNSYVDVPDNYDYTWSAGVYDY